LLDLISKESSMKAAAKKELIAALGERFEAHPERHTGIDWSAVKQRIEASSAKLDTLGEMERTGGEPDVIGFDKKAGGFLYCDCSAESPDGRRSLCFDGEALEARKKNKPAGSATDMAATIGIDLLTEAQYRALQKLGEFDTKTSSWIQTPTDVRALGGALFCDRRYDTVFVYHNGAESYYAARGFRGLLVV
jgi:hypothetical protein